MRLRLQARIAALGVAAGLLATAALPGCCPGTRYMYRGAIRPTSETATLSVGNGNVGIVAVDGESTVCFPGRASFEVVVLPGEHEVQVTWRGTPATSVVGHYSTGEALLRFEAIAGHRYAVGAERGSYWVSDRDTGTVVCTARGGGPGD